MPGSAWRFVAVLFVASVGWISSAHDARAQLRITPPTDPDPVPQVTVKPVLEDETTPTPALVDDNPETLKQRLKETEDRLHAYEKDYEALTRRNELKTTTIRNLNESLAMANAECEVFRRQFFDLNTRMEAFGLASVGDDKEALEQRLLHALNDLRLVRLEKDKLAESTTGLAESVLLYIKTATVSDPQIRLQVEAQIRAANEAIDEASAQEAPASRLVEGNLNNGNVISVKEELSLVVVNFGSLQGIKVGAPLQVVRGDKLVGRARIVDVRQRISGAVMEEYGSNSEKVKVGDTVRVEVQSVQS